MTRKTSHPSYRAISNLLRAVSQPARLEILLALGTGEACVCHLEAATGKRQAYISQQLMELREAGIVTTRREGRYIFYKLQHPDIMELIQVAARVAGISPNQIGGFQILEDCSCPFCIPQYGTDCCGLNENAAKGEQRDEQLFRDSV